MARFYGALEGPAVERGLRDDLSTVPAWAGVVRMAQGWVREGDTAFEVRRVGALWAAIEAPAYCAGTPRRSSRIGGRRAFGAAGAAGQNGAAPGPLCPPARRTATGLGSRATARYSRAMAEPAPRFATWHDLRALPEAVRAEVLGGAIEVLPSHSVAHQIIAGNLSSDISSRFMRGRGGPGGWWIVADVDVELSTHDVVRPDLSGWRKDRVPQPPRRPVLERPDWVCEVLSPGNGRHDRLIKMELYRRREVPHVWLVDPELRLLEAYRLESGLYLRLGAWSDEADARVKPFDAIPLDVADLFAFLDTLPPPPVR